MSLKSMTGFGRGEAAGRGWKVEVEVSSVNRKQFDVQVGLPRSLATMEALIYDAVHHRLSRGSVTVSVRVSAAGGASRADAAVDEVLAASYVRQLRSVAGRLGLRDDLSARTLAALPDVVQRRSLPEDVRVFWPLVKRALAEALEGLARMREAEGAALERDVRRRVRQLVRIHAQIRKVAPSVLERYRRTLEERLRAAGLGDEAAAAGLHREIVMFADRSNIAEEIVRLGSHFKQAGDLMAEVKPVGRTLDFLCQEMFREINTIGSKANDARISARVVDFKTELECVREQVQNVE